MIRNSFFGSSSFVEIESEQANVTIESVINWIITRIFLKMETYCQLMILFVRYMNLN